MENWLPSHEKTDRKVWDITFHQGTKHRDFVCGLAPNVQPNGGAFKVVHGPLFHATYHAMEPNAAAMIVIDELNRGPAVAIFGDLITAMENDKRSLPDGSIGAQTRTFSAVDDKGDPTEIALPYHVYLVGSMNEADTSVEPLDVAFLRRWAPYRLHPNELTLRSYFRIPDAVPRPQVPTEPSHVFEAVVGAWTRVNKRIALARGPEFQLGHGVFMEGEAAELPNDLSGALGFAAMTWSRVHRHVSEVFHGDTRGIAATISASEVGNPFQLTEEYFADSPVLKLDGPEEIMADTIYPLLLSIAESG